MLNNIVMICLDPSWHTSPPPLWSKIIFEQARIDNKANHRTIVYLVLAKSVYSESSHRYKQIRKLNSPTTKKIYKLFMEKVLRQSVRGWIIPLQLAQVNGEIWTLSYWNTSSKYINITKYIYMNHLSARYSYV